MSARCGVRLLAFCTLALALASCGGDGDDPSSLPVASATPPPARQMPLAPTSAPIASPPVTVASVGWIRR